MFTSPILKSKSFVYQNKNSRILDVIERPIALTEKSDNTYGAGDEEVLVKIHYAAFNPVDIILKSLVFPILNRWYRDFGLCNDYSGEIVDIGDKAAAQLGLKKGDFVCGQTLPGSYHKTLTQYVKFELSSKKFWVMIKKPEGISMAEAGSFALVYSTAATIIAQCEIPDNAKILVNGASTSVGYYVTSLLKNNPKVKEIVGICSGKSEPKVKSLGADEVIDYTKSNYILNDVLGHCKDRLFDVYIDCCGSDVLMKNADSFIVKGGYFMSIAAGKKIKLLKDSLYSIITFPLIKRAIFSALGLSSSKFVQSQTIVGEGFDEVSELFELGKIKPHVDSVFSFDQAQQAYDLVVSGANNGKVVVQVTEDLNKIH